MTGERLKTFSRDVRFAVQEKEDPEHARRARADAARARRQRRARPDPRRVREGRSRRV